MDAQFGREAAKLNRQTFANYSLSLWLDAWFAACALVCDYFGSQKGVVTCLSAILIVSVGVNRKYRRRSAQLFRKAGERTRQAPPD